MEEMIPLDAQTENNSTSNENDTTVEFKKPILVGKIGQLPKKIKTTVSSKEDKISDDISQQTEATSTVDDIEVVDEDVCSTTDQVEKPSLIPYKEPPWSSLPTHKGKAYILEVLKSGSIVEQIDLMKKPYWIIGRSGTCDIPLAHPAISRYHAVLQYRGEGTEKDPAGFYIYDLASTHGSFLNKLLLKKYVFVPVRVGHILKFGYSTRSFVLTGPDEDAEEESKYTMTELKQQRAEKLLQRELTEKEALLKEQQEVEEKRKRDEERGVDWGLGEDAEEEPDLAENPYAQTNNEELYLEDPKKALRGFMEREGFTLDYDCSEHGFGQFLCKVVLPLDDEHGRPVIAEVLHKGKKKEAVVQCALEACRILDRHGVLRQATHESRKRKAKNWEENDYYDSDDDTYLDRTGSVEKKRENRMKTKLPQQPETYQSLLNKEKKIKMEIHKIEKELANAKLKNNNESNNANDEDALDSYMKELKQTKLSKQSISQLKSSLARLRADLATVGNLLNLTKPTDLPQLLTDKPFESAITESMPKQNLPMFGKRSKTKLQIPLKPVNTQPSSTIKIDNDEEDEDSEMISNSSTQVGVKTHSPIRQKNSKHCESPTHLEKNLTCDTRKLSTEDTVYHQAVNSDNDNDEFEDDTKDDKELTPEELKKRQKRNLRRIKQRQGKAEIQKQKGYEEDSHKEDYNMWLPPANQTGDGKTSLNEKFGY